MLKIRILLIGSQALAQVIEHLFRDRHEFEIMRSSGGLKKLPVYANRFLPTLIVADIRPVSTGICRMVEAVKRSSPSAKLILICPITGLMRGARKCGADACLGPENLALSLLPTALALSQPLKRHQLSA